MPHVTYFAASSLDGRIAGPNDDLGFLDLFEGTFPDGPYNMWALIAGFDSLVMGATTFRVIQDRIEAGVHETWPYGDRPAWVVTHARELPGVSGARDVRPFSGDVRRLMERWGGRRSGGLGWWAGAISPASFSTRILSTRSFWESLRPCSGADRPLPKVSSLSANSA